MNKPFAILITLLLSVAVSPLEVMCSNPALENPSSIFFHARVGDLNAITADLNRAPELINAIDPAGRTPLIYAAKAGHDKIVNYLLGREGVRTDLIDVYGNGLTHWPAIYGHLMVLDALHAHGIPLDFRNRDGETALHLAMGNVFTNEHKKHAEIVRRLLLHGADPNARDDSGRTPIFQGATLLGQASAIHALLADERTEVNAQDRYGGTAIRRAVMTGSVTSIKILLAHGADPTIKDNHGQSAIDAIQWFEKVSSQINKESMLVEMRSLLKAFQEK